MNELRINTGAASWNPSSGFTFSEDRLNLSGEGPHATLITFDPAAADTLITIEKALVATFNVSGITNADPAVATTATTHSLVADDKVIFAGVGGMTQVNGVTYTVGTVTATTFTLRTADDTANIDSSGYGVFTSGGTVSEIAAGGTFQCSIRDIGIRSNNEVDVTAIDLFNIANINIDRVGIILSGDNSIAIRTQGRQLARIRDSEIAAARPIVLDPNPVFPTISGDYFIIDGCEIISTIAAGDATDDHACISVAPGSCLSNFKVQNTALVGGLHGVYWNDEDAPATSLNVGFENIRREQGTDAAGWSWYIRILDQGVTGLTFKNCLTDLFQNGIHIEVNAATVHFDSCQFPQTSGTSLEVVFTAGTVVVLTNCVFGTVAPTMTNGKRAWHARLGPSNTQRAGTEIWVYDASGGTDQKVGVIQQGGTVTGPDVTLAADATHDIADSGFTGYLYITTNEGTSATFHLAGAGTAVSKRDDATGQFSATEGNANTTNVYWHAGSSRYRLQNKRGAQKTYNYTKKGRAV